MQYTLSNNFYYVHYIYQHRFLPRWAVKSNRSSPRYTRRELGHRADIWFVRLWPVASLHSLSRFHLSFYCHENVQYFDLRWRRRDRWKHHNVTTNWNFSFCESLYTELYLFRYMIQRRVDSRLFYMRNVGLTSCFYTCFVMNKSRRFTMQCITSKEDTCFTKRNSAKNISEEQHIVRKYINQDTHWQLNRFISLFFVFHLNFKYVG